MCQILLLLYDNYLDIYMKNSVNVLHKYLALFLISIFTLSTILTIPLVEAESLDVDARFEFLSLPEKVNSGELFNFTLKALDDTQNLDSTYLGTVTFSVSTDENAVLPTDYTFTAEDAGQHIFSGVAKLYEGGDHLLTVSDSLDNTLKGSISMQVNVNDEGQAKEEGVITVTSPVVGDTDNNIVNFVGTADPGLEISVFDNGELLMTDYVDANGEFDFNSAVLPDAAYSFTLETSTAVSDSINININVSADILEGVVVDKLKLGTGETINVQVSLNSGASIVKVLLDEEYTELQLTDTIMAKSFGGEVKVPEYEGEFPLSLQIVLPSGESVDVKDVKTITVEFPTDFEDGDTHGSGNEEDTNNEDLTFFVPSQVLGVQAVEDDKKVILAWSPATDNNYIDHYLIYYGSDQNNLDKFVQTNNADTTWYIPNLVNGVTYYFSVFGVDDEGHQGDIASTFVSAMPSLVGSNSLHGQGEGQVVVLNTSETGPEIYFLLFFSIGFSYVLRFKM